MQQVLASLSLRVPLCRRLVLHDAPPWPICLHRRRPAAPSTSPPPRPFLPTAVDEYVAKAAALTSDLQQLAQLRAGLRERMMQVSFACLLCWAGRSKLGFPGCC